MGKNKRADPLTPNDKSTTVHPRKRFFRARAHSNPLNDFSFDVPARPEDADWSEHYPSFFPSGGNGSGSSAAAAGEGQDGEQGEASTSGRQPQERPVVRFADVGCGFGGLLIKLSPLYPDTLMLGMELRDKVSAYVRERIAALRREHPGQYGNVSVLRTNAMKFLPNHFAKGQLTKMFFLFPDPHFKAANHRRRIVNTSLVTEYAHLLAPGGWLYTITDVQELGVWMRAKMDAHLMFERISDEELASDPAACMLAESSEEGQKVARNGGQTYRSVYRRLPGPRAATAAAAAAPGAPAAAEAAPAPVDTAAEQ